MPTITLYDKSFPDTDFSGFGNANTKMTIDGVEYPLFQAIFVAGLNEMDRRAGRVGGIGDAFRLTFSTTTTDGDPGAGTFRLNSATQNAATEIYIDDADTAGSSIAAAIATWTAGSSLVKGTLSIRDPATAGAFLLYDVTGVTDASGYTKVSLSIRAYSSANPFTGGDVLTIGFVRKGDRGDQGGSYSYLFDDATSDADPGAGELRANSGDLSAVTEIYISDTEAGGVDIAADISSWDDGTSSYKGSLIIRGSQDTTDWARYRLTALTDAGDYFQLTVEHIASTGTGFLSAGEAITVTFHRAGDKGDTGDASAGGAIAGDFDMQGNAIVDADLPDAFFYAIAF